LKTPSYTVYDYTASGQMDLKSTYIPYIQYTYTSIQYIYLSYNKIVIDSHP